MNRTIKTRKRESIAKSKKLNESLEYFRNGTVRGAVLDKAVNDFGKSGIEFDILKKY